MTSNEIVVKNEFAAASLRLVQSGGATQLLIEDLETHRRVTLDALMVASLARAEEAFWDSIVDPTRAQASSSGYSLRRDDSAVQ